MDGTMNTETVTGNEEREASSGEQPQHSKSPYARVERFRNSLREHDCGRLDVWIGSGWIRGMHLIANYNKQPLWECVQDAIKAYVAANAKINVAPKDRSR
jgi:hypothetical protein